MKIIELLNKISRGEEVPKKIKWGCHIYIWVVVEYKALDEFGEPLFSEQAGYTKYSLNDEVEIIEDKKIEKLKIVENGSINSYALLDKNGTKCALTKHSKIIADKINEIIDVINGDD